MIDLPQPLQWILIIVCLIGSFLFSASENALSCCNRYYFKVKANEGKLTGKLVTFILNKYDNFLITGLVGNNLAAVGISSIATILFLDMLLPYISNSEVISIITTLIVTIVVFIFGDMLPKYIAKAIPNRMSVILSYILFFFFIILFPVVMLFRGLVFIIKKIFKVKDEVLITEEEFKEAVDEVNENGILEDDENKILKNSFNFDLISVKQVLTLKDDIVQINRKNLTVQKLNKIILNNSYSRMPVYEDNDDNIIGILNVRKYFREYTKDPHLNIDSILDDPYFVNENDKIDDIFKGFNENKTHIAIVKNDKNEVVGMITMEDILEEIVGDINENKVDLLNKRGNK